MRESTEQTVEAQWVVFFREAYQRLYSPFLAQLTLQEVEGITSLLQLPQEELILDLGCATGRHAIELAKRGYKVVGLDFDEDLLAIARLDAHNQGVQIDWVPGDMRDVPFENVFGAAINVFSSFGLFEQEEDNLLVLSQIWKALKPEGLLLLDVLQLSRVLRIHNKQGVTKYDDGLVVVEERDFDLFVSRYNVQTTLFCPDGERRGYSHSLRVYTPPELHRMLKACGFELLASYGSLLREPLTLDSRLVIVCRKTLRPPESENTGLPLLF